MFYIIVKEAADDYWKERFKQDPKKMPMDYELSAYHSELGKVVQCKPYYDVQDINQARLDCSKLNHKDPGNGYALCPMRN